MKFHKTIRVTISEEFADILLELFREMLEAGRDFDETVIDDYDNFFSSVSYAKMRRRYTDMIERRAKRQ